jgi:hypothetical protein
LSRSFSWRYSHAVNRWYLEIGPRSSPGRSRYDAALSVRARGDGPRHVYFDGSRLVTKVDAASDPSRIGSDQVRGVRFERDLMILSPPPRRAGEREEYRELTWERIATE